ncbi:MAG: ATP phosphoribosyltransferase regulatory subunit [Lachnospiraceae bacterium]|nr:ATP phosphoribosyltransferase regulatory subunit [Lachnospiraceae bacterium]
MYKKLIHTPEGVRDIYGIENRNKLAVEDSIMKLIRNYGYEDIQTPVFEFFDIFSGNIGTIPSKELYKFFDKEGNTLALRPDFTPSIARATAKYFADDNMPLRFCYIGNTFNNTMEYRGRLKETTEIGAELINDDSVDADVEVLMMVIEALLKCGIRDFQLSIGNVEFFKGLCAEYGINEEMELKLRETINDKSYFGTQDILDSLDLKDNVKEIFSRMPEMFGGLDTLKEAAGYVTNERSRGAIERLQNIYDILKHNGMDAYVTFDPGMLSKYNYYTGIIFRAYTYGSGDAVIKGGRYDNLLSEFGKSAPAVGFCIMVDQLLSVLSRQNISIKLPGYDKYLLSYNEKTRRDAYLKAIKLREQGKCVVMVNERVYDRDSINTYADENGYKHITAEDEA